MNAVQNGPNNPLEGLPMPYRMQDGMVILQTMLLELLAASRQASSTSVKGCLASARACALTLETLTRLVGKSGDHTLPPPLLAVLERTARDARERTEWRALLEARQYQTLVNRLDEEVWGSVVVRERRRGMGTLSRQLAQRALALRARGVTWSRLVGEMIRALQNEGNLDAEAQVILERLRERQARRSGAANGAYLRLLTHRYKAEWVERQTKARAGGSFLRVADREAKGEWAV